jgi:predicted enzyme related to lactoylglutathione lyase
VSERLELTAWKTLRMAEPEIEILDIIIDCADPASLASFWGELLGLPIAGHKGPYVWLQRSAHAPGLGFQKVSQPKTGKNRVHLDVSASDIPAAKLRIEALGGRRIDGFEDGGFLVMADPQGNEFCVVPTAPFEFDEQGRTNYLDNMES